jgi:hypothetical protein
MVIPPAVGKLEEERIRRTQEGGDPMAHVVHSTGGFERERYHHRRDSRVERRTTDRGTATRDTSGSRREG